MQPTCVACGDAGWIPVETPLGSGRRACPHCAAGRSWSAGVSTALGFAAGATSFPACGGRGHVDDAGGGVQPRRRPCDCAAGEWFLTARRASAGSLWRPN